jgi:hypothetical protein
MKGAHSGIKGPYLGIKGATLGIKGPHLEIKMPLSEIKTAHSGIKTPPATSHRSFAFSQSTFESCPGLLCHSSGAPLDHQRITTFTQKY